MTIAVGTLRRYAVCAAVLTASLHAVPLFAQQTVGVPGNPLGTESPLTAPAPQRPFRTLFGPAPESRRTMTQQMDFTGSVFAARGNLTGAQAPTVGDVRYQTDTTSAGATAMLNYAALLPKVSFNAFGGTAMNYYVSFPAPYQMSYSGGVGATTTIGRRTTLSGSQTISYAPFLGFYPFAGLLPLAPADVSGSLPSDQYAAGADKSLRLGTTARITRTFGRKSSIGAHYSMSRTTFSDSPDSTWQSAGATYARGLTRHASFHAGYAYQSGFYGSAPGFASNTLGNHNVNIGVHYGRSLSPWRRTKITFGTGSSVARRLDSQQNPAATPARGPYSLFLTGFAAISRELGRSWNVRGTYDRSVNYAPGFGAPFFADAISGAVGGALGPRLTAHGTVSGSRGSVGLAPRGTSPTTYGNNFWAYTASAGAQYGLSRHWALYGSYVYYSYQFGSAVPLPGGMLPSTGRQSIQGGLTTWWPVFRR